MVQLEHANALADAGKIDDAAAEIRARAKGKPDYDTAIALAEIYQKGKRWAEESKALDQAESLANTDSEKIGIYFRRGALLERSKKYDASEAQFRKVLELDPQNAETLNYLGYMLADRGLRLDEAQEMIKKALDQYPDNGAFLDSLAWVYYHQGKFDEAEGLLLRALQHMQDPTVHDHLGDVYLKLGKTKEAITQWQASLKAFQQDTQGDTDPEEMASVNKKLEGALARLAKDGKK
jgi:tetratricopeptide (TPR) repeat protein